MLEDVAVPDVPGSGDVEGEGLAVVVAELHSRHRHLHFRHENHVQELPFVFARRLLAVGDHVGPDVDLFGDAVHSSCLELPVHSLPFVLVLLDVEIEPSDDLEIHQVNVDGVVIHGKVYDIEIINSTILE